MTTDTDKLCQLEEFLNSRIRVISKAGSLSDFGQGRLSAFKLILAELQEPEDDEEVAENDVDYYSFIPEKHR